MRVQVSKIYNPVYNLLFNTYFQYIKW